MRSLDKTLQQDIKPQGVQSEPPILEGRLLGKLAKRKRLVFALFIIVTLLASLAIIFRPKGYNLTINAEPEGSAISVSGNLSASTKFEKKLPPGSYEIIVSKEGYITERQTIRLSQGTVFDIVLTKEIDASKLKTSQVTSVKPFSTTNLSPLTKDALVGIDQATSYLVKITQKSIATLYSKPVAFYSFVPPLVALVEVNDPTKIVLLDIEKGSLRAFSAEGLSPIVSVSLAPDLKSIYFLASYNANARNSKLFSSGIDVFSPKELFVTSADKVEVASLPQVILFESADALDKSSLTVFDVEKKRAVASLTGNSYLLSPTKGVVAVQSSNSIIFVNLNTFSKKIFPFSSSNRYAWKNDLLVVLVKNRLPGVEISYLNGQSLTTTSSLPIVALESVSVRSVAGVIGDYLFLADTQGKLWQIILP